MLKSLFIPVVFSILAMFGLVQTGVNLSLNMPESSNAGNEFLVEVKIEKGDVEGFARFEQELPVGFKAVGRNTANGDFRFENNKVKVQWMKVPLDREIVISYAVAVDPTVSGDFEFGGKFSYIQDNGVKTAEVLSSRINIVGDETAAGTMAAANSTYSYQNVSLKSIDCIRQKPYLNDANEVVINLLINKGALKDFGKIQEQIPRGYRALSLRSKNSIFTYKNGVIKFLWMNMPREEQFVVSYKLIPEGDIPDQQFIITGTFSYAENERTKTVNIAERNVDLETFDGIDLVVSNEDAQSSGSEDGAISNSTSSSSSSGSTDAVVNGSTTSVAVDYTNSSNENNTTTTNSTSSSSGNSVSDNAENYGQQASGNLAHLTGIPLPEQGVDYRVQVAAGHKLVGKNYFKQLNITDNVQVELHDGWHKYTVGNFNQYKDARDYRIYIWNNTPIHDAFVSAYNSGMRITVQEALMIGNQKWYK